ncbi:MAG: RNA polymerase sigma-70 factor [Cyclobacteriaceae bacterium]
MRTEDRAIIGGLKKGNELAYQQLFNEYYSLLISYAMKFVKTPDLARDVVQEVFIRLYDKRSNINISTSLKSYLIKSVYHQCLLSLKNDQTFMVPNEADLTIDQDLLEQAEAETLIWAAIDELPEQCRRIFIMNRFEGLSNQKIADRLSISKRTVETQISKALKILRGKLLIIIYLMNI